MCPKGTPTLSYPHLGTAVDIALLFIVAHSFPVGFPKYPQSYTGISCSDYCGVMIRHYGMPDIIAKGFILVVKHTRKLVYIPQVWNMYLTVG